MKRTLVFAFAMTAIASTIIVTSVASSTTAQAKVSVRGATQCALASGGNKVAFKACMAQHHGGKAVRWICKRLGIRC